MKLLIITLLLPIFISAQSWKDIKKAAGKVNNEIKNATNKVKTFTEEEAASALKQTLNKGVENGVNILSVPDGFYKNEKVKIPFPPEAENIKKQLKKIGIFCPTPEGRPKCDWVLVDAGSVIVHLFRSEIREYYKLDKLWDTSFDIIENNLTL